MRIAPLLKLTAAAVVELGLHAGNRVFTSPQLAERTRRTLMLGAALVAVFIGLSGSGFSFLCGLFSRFEFGTFAFELFVDGDQLCVFRRVQAITLLLQSHAPRLELCDTLFRVGFLQLRQLGIALDRVDRLLHIGKRRGRSPQCSFGNRQRNVRGIDDFLVFSVFRRRNGDSVIGIGYRFRQLHRLFLRSAQSRLPLLGLGGHTLRTIPFERELLLGARHFGIDFVERALRRVLRIVLGENVLPQAFELSHQRLQLGFFRQQCGFGFAEGFNGGFALANSLIAPLREQQRLALDLFFFQLTITCGNLRLPVKPLNLRRQLDLNIVNTR